MILFKKVYLDFRSDWHPVGASRIFSVVVCPGVLIPIPGLSSEEELQFRGFNALSIHWLNYVLTISYKGLGKFRYHDFCWNSFMLWLYDIIN
jgi:hypothetical protein